MHPEYVGPSIPDDYDVLGCGFRDVSYGTGVYRECVYHPLAQYETVEEVEANYTLAGPRLVGLSRCIPDQLLGKEEYPIQGGGSEPFLLYARMRGMEQAYMDLLVNPELALYCLDKLFDLAYTETVRIYEQIPGKVTLSYVAEDFGSQVSLLFAPATIREVFIPRMKRMMDLAHSAGAYVFYHSDGAIRPILPDMIAAGIDILNPIQWRCRGMERAALKAGLSATRSSSTAAWTTSTRSPLAASTRCAPRSWRTWRCWARAAATSWRPVTTFRRLARRRILWQCMRPAMPNGWF